MVGDMGVRMTRPLQPQHARGRSVSDAMIRRNGGVDFSERFWAKVDVRDSPEECWEWRSSVSKNGYGAFGLRGAVIGSHRIAFILANGGIPHGAVVMHSCDNRRCCNPHHLSAGTQSENMIDCSRKGRMNTGGCGRAEANHQSKMDWLKVAKARALLKSGASLRSVARQFGISHPTMAAIRDGRTWKD